MTNNPADNYSMAPPLKFIITISNTEDLALLGLIEMSADEDNFVDVFKHKLRSLFNDPRFAENAGEFALQTRALKPADMGIEIVFDPADIVELADAQQEA